MEWLLPESIDIPESFQDGIGGHPLVSQLLIQRGFSDLPQAEAFLDPERYAPSSPTDLPDLDFAARRLLEGIKSGERILVWGDFDVDGQTSTTLLVDALQTLGAQVGFHIPHRLKEGHGVHIPELMERMDAGYRLILTCDTGVAAHDAIDAAHARGGTVLVTDHHALPATLPEQAAAIVNPQRLPEGHPLRDLPGVGVAYKLVQHLFSLAGRGGEDERLLDLVALGIVADVARQRWDTRYLLQKGIERLRLPERVGLRELIRAAQVDPGNLAADTIGFQIGPRLNALGRLGDAALAVELLTTEDEVQAAQIAQQLELLNNQRKQIENQIYAAAQEQIAAEPSLAGDEAIILGGMHWHPGVIGIVASRLVEKYNKPVLLLAMPEGKAARGSARSVAGVDIGAAIAANDDLLLGHGGHPGAAGVTLDPDLIPQFRRRLSDTVARTRDRSVRVGRQVDAVVSLGDLSMEMAEELNRLAPFGEGNPAIALMTRHLKVVSDAGFGIDRSHRRVTIEDESGTSQVVTWWRGSEYESELPAQFDLLYIPRINDYKGRHSLQLEWVDFRPVEGLEIRSGPRYMPVDLRGEADVLAALPANGYRVWAEGVDAASLPFDAALSGTRETLGKADALVIWTAPPGPRELSQVLARTEARTIYVAAAHIPHDGPESFLKRLAGLVKYATRMYDEGVPITRLAGATAQREITVRRGLEWLEAKGQTEVEWLDSGLIRFGEGIGTSEAHLLENLEGDLQALLAEADAFRAYFRQADLTQFFT